MSDDGTLRPFGAFDSAAPGHYGVSPGAVTLAEIPISVAWNVQGDPLHPAFLAEAKRRFGLALPLVPNTTARGPAWKALWLGPKSWLLMAGDETVIVPPAGFDAQRDALNAAGGALFDLSASRVAFMVKGLRAAAVLAKNCPLDFHPRAFLAGNCAQSLLGHINALIERPDATPTFVVMVPRSFAQDGWRQLCRSSAQYGYDVVVPVSMS